MSLAATTVSPHLCPGGTKRVVHQGWSECCKVDREIGPGRCFRDGPVERYRKKELLLDRIEYRNDQKNGTYTFWAEDGSQYAKGSFTDDFPDGEWEVNRKWGGIKAKFKSGKLAEVIDYSEKNIQMHKIQNTTSEIIKKNLIGAYHPSFNFETKTNTKTNYAATILYADASTTKVVGIIGGGYTFIGPNVFNDNKISPWGTYLLWSVHDKKNGFCQIQISGSFFELRPKMYSDYSAWVKCDPTWDLVDFYKLSSLGVHLDTEFFSSPNGKRVYPKAPKSNEENVDFFDAVILEDKVVGGVRWVKISLSFNEHRDISVAWVRLYKDYKPVFQVFTD